MFVFAKPFLVVFVPCTRFGHPKNDFTVNSTPVTQHCRKLQTNFKALKWQGRPKKHGCRKLIFAVSKLIFAVILWDSCGTEVHVRRLRRPGGPKGKTVHEGVGLT